jgi:hypothetical protein
MAVSLITPPLMHSFSSNGVIIWMYYPQNGKAGHILRTINDMLRFLLFQASILARYWVEWLHTTTYMSNRLPTKVSSMTSPYIDLHGVAPL